MYKLAQQTTEHEIYTDEATVFSFSYMGVTLGEATAAIKISWGDIEHGEQDAVAERGFFNENGGFMRDSSTTLDFFISPPNNMECKNKPFSTAYYLWLKSLGCETPEDGKTKILHNYGTDNIN